MRQVFLAFAVAILLSACEKASAPQKNVQNPSTKEYRVVFLLAPSGKGDKSYNDTSLEGAERSEFSKKIKIRTILPGRPEDYLDIIRQLVAEQTDLIIGVGFLYGDTFRAVSKENANTRFLLLDADVGPSTNVRSVVFRPDEGSFLAGVAAATMSATSSIGFIGGMDIPIIRLFGCGFENGARTVADRNKRPIRVRMAYIGTTPDAFSNPGKGQELAAQIYSTGTDIIYHAAAASGSGVIQAAKKSHKFAIGVDTDQSYLAPEAVLTSMRKRLDVAVETAIKDVITGTFSGGTREMSLSNGGIELVKPGKLSANALAAVAEFEKKLVAHEISACPSPK